MQVEHCILRFKSVLQSNAFVDVVEARLLDTTISGFVNHIFLNTASLKLIVIYSSFVFRNFIFSLSYHHYCSPLSDYLSPIIRQGLPDRKRCPEFRQPDKRISTVLFDKDGSFNVSAFDCKDPFFLNHAVLICIVSTV